MTNGSLIQLIELLIALGVMTWFFYNPWQSLMVDMTRQRLFETREKVFLMATEGKIDFDSDVYRELRHRLNLSIRFCHFAKISRLLTSLYLQSRESRHQRDQQNNHSKSLHAIITSIENEETRDDVRLMIRETTIIILSLMVIRSPITIALSMIALPLVLVTELLNGFKPQTFSDIGSNLDKDIYLVDRLPV